MDICDDIVWLRGLQCIACTSGESEKDPVKDSRFHESLRSILDCAFNESIIHSVVDSNAPCLENV